MMKCTLAITSVVLALAASSAMAQGIFSPRSADPTDRAARDARRANLYTDANHWNATSEGWQGSTMEPAYRGQDIRNANSALWGVGG